MIKFICKFNKSSRSRVPAALERLICIFMQCAAALRPGSAYTAFIFKYLFKKTGSYLYNLYIFATLYCSVKGFQSQFHCAQMHEIVRYCSEIARNFEQLRAIFRSLEGSQLRASKIHLRWKPQHKTAFQFIQRTVVFLPFPFVRSREYIPALPRQRKSFNL